MHYIPHMCKPRAVQVHQKPDIPHVHKPALQTLVFQTCQIYCVCARFLTCTCTPDIPGFLNTQQYIWKYSCGISRKYQKNQQSPLNKGRWRQVEDLQCPDKCQLYFPYPLHQALNQLCIYCQPFNTNVKSVVCMNTRVSHQQYNS